MEVDLALDKQSRKNLASFGIAQYREAGENGALGPSAAQLVNRAFGSVPVCATPRLRQLEVLTVKEMTWKSPPVPTLRVCSTGTGVLGSRGVSAVLPAEGESVGVSDSATTLHLRMEGASAQDPILWRITVTSKCVPLTVGGLHGQPGGPAQRRVEGDSVAVSEAATIRRPHRTAEPARGLTRTLRRATVINAQCLVPGDRGANGHLVA